MDLDEGIVKTAEYLRQSYNMPDNFIPLMVPDIQQQDIDAMIKVLQSGMLIQGIRVQEFENNIAKYLGVKYAIAVANGTASLHLALVALGIGKGDEVIIPAFSYIATANAVELVGATPVFVDVDITTYNIKTTLLNSHHSQDKSYITSS